MTPPQPPLPELHSAGGCQTRGLFTDRRYTALSSHDCQTPAVALASPQAGRGMPCSRPAMLPSGWGGRPGGRRPPLGLILVGSPGAWCLPAPGGNVGAECG